MIYEFETTSELDLIIFLSSEDEIPSNEDDAALIFPRIMISRSKKPKIWFDLNYKSVFYEGCSFEIFYKNVNDEFKLYLLNNLDLFNK